MIPDTDPDSGNALPDLAKRREALAVLARADSKDIARGLHQIHDRVSYSEPRAPEIGLVMLRGRIGSRGAPFNAGEATVTRAAVQLASGETGFGYVFGRDREKARLVALCDALWQVEDRREAVETQILAPLRQKQKEQQDLARARTAATRVDFFTLVRGED
ncbi:phosphonate C-P lyase system protein PhnG [Undibacter mobilis]|uniref:Phosphonate C-P lyase system protein PhnG n=1 Tax=Undibacter mobilis TaxID=2292256 RepID=A0A371B9N4_9BRAD|nr:phosphonate C-P lyase system protein PhnG [Undibacter mobilis]RDV04319.1 phosphonate C-P lyase system protein PhnG [Undibacter mobilis]